MRMNELAYINKAAISLLRASEKLGLQKGYIILKSGKRKGIRV